MMIANRKGQEEVVGFVLIMVTVAIIFLVFLGISIRQGGSDIKTDSSDVYHFLESSMEFTTDCAFSSVPDYYSLSELFEECYSGNNCLSGDNSCEILNFELEGILSNSWFVDSEGRIKGYEFESFYTSDSEQNEEIISISEGECLSSVRGASYLIPAFPGRIEVIMSICF